MFAIPLPQLSEFVPLGIELSIKISKRYSPACTRLLSQYKTMLRLVGDDVPSVEEFMSRYKVGVWDYETHSFCLNSMI